MGLKDYYGILNINRDATEDDIKKAYRKLAIKLHPDTNKDKDGESRFKALNEAYSVLSDKQKRQIYDRTERRADQPFQQRRGMNNCRRGMGMGKCSGLAAVFYRRPRHKKSISPIGSISE